MKQLVCIFVLCGSLCVYGMEESNNDNAALVESIAPNVQQTTILPTQGTLTRLRNFISRRQSNQQPPISLEEARKLEIERYISKSDFTKVHSLFDNHADLIPGSNTDFDRYIACAQRVYQERQNSGLVDMPWSRFIPFILLSGTALGLTFDAIAEMLPWQTRMGICIGMTAGTFMHGLKTLYPTWNEYHYSQAQNILYFLKERQSQRANNNPNN